MDLILFRPGDTSVFPAHSNDGASGGSVVSASADWAANPAIGKGLEELKLGQCIELVSVHQGMKQQVTTDVSNSARTSGRPVMTEFTCVKYVDKTSVNLYDFCLRAKSLGGKATPSYIYILRNSGDKLTNIITFMLRDALISDIQFQTHPDDMPTEEFKLNFTEIVWTSGVQTADLQGQSSVTAGWSLTRNRPLTDFT
jgi:type VI secretion system secreted protein Hcp